MAQVLNAECKYICDFLVCCMTIIYVKECLKYQWPNYLKVTSGELLDISSFFFFFENKLYFSVSMSCLPLFFCTTPLQQIDKDE